MCPSLSSVCALAGSDERCAFRFSWTHIRGSLWSRTLHSYNALSPSIAEQKTKSLQDAPQEDKTIAAENSQRALQLLLHLANSGSSDYMSYSIELFHRNIEAPHPIHQYTCGSATVAEHITKMKSLLTTINATLEKEEEKQKK